MLRAKKGVIGAVVLLALVGAGAVAWWGGGAGREAAERYRTEAVDRGAIAQSVSANGTLNPVKLVDVGTQVSGTVKRLKADYNDRVEVGQVLMELDDALFAAAVRQSEANLANAQANLALASANTKRIEALFAKEYVSRQERDQAEQAATSARAVVEQARAQIDRDRINLGNTVIRSPVAGVVVAREVNEGQTVAASFQTPTLFRIAQDLTQMQIDSNFSEADVGQIKVDQIVKFRVDAFPDRQFEGRVRQVRLDPTTVQNVVTYNVVVGVDNPDRALLPGMTAYVTVVTSERDDVIRIPNAALRFKPNDAPAAQAPRGPGGRPRAEPRRATVYLLREGKLAAAPVTTGVSNGRYTELAAGEIKVGDALVVEDLTTVTKPANSGAPPSGFRMRMF